MTIINDKSIQNYFIHLVWILTIDPPWMSCGWRQTGVMVESSFVGIFWGGERWPEGWNGRCLAVIRHEKTQIIQVDRKKEIHYNNNSHVLAFYKFDLKYSSFPWMTWSKSTLLPEVAYGLNYFISRNNVK